MALELELSVSGEGGSMKLIGEHTGDGWLFYKERNEAALADFLSEDDNDIRSALIATSDKMDNFKEAMDLLGSSWMLLGPTYVHPLFSRTIMDYVMADDKKRPGRVNLSVWERVVNKDNPILKAAEAIQEANNMVVITGAGCSVDAGVPDFRSQAFAR